jgi:hypothetical protein
VDAKICLGMGLSQLNAPGKRPPLPAQAINQKIATLLNQTQMLAVEIELVDNDVPIGSQHRAAAMWMDRSRCQHQAQGQSWLV